MNMRGALALALVVFVATPTLASQWIYIAGTDDGSMNVYVDRASISRRDKDIFSAWVMNDYHPSKPEHVGTSIYRSEKVLMMYWCESGLARLITSTSYSDQMGHGSAVVTTDEPTAISPVVPDSVGEHMLQFVCNADVRIRDTTNWRKTGLTRMPFKDELSTSSPD